ncbi:MAG TPA: xanthine dehydrogenase family protein subunit M, partial [Ktedonobacteraceae bacterium]
PPNQPQYITVCGKGEICMPGMIPEWLAPASLAEALEMKASYGDEATIVAGGTFIGILMSQKLMAPNALLTLRHIRELTFIEDNEQQLRIGAMTTHCMIERSPIIREHWPILAYTFSLVASPRVRNQATIGGVLADADYASDPPSMLHALNASVVVRSKQGERIIAVEDLITGYYETSLKPDELVTEIRLPCKSERAVYRKFRSRSSEDRPCVAVAAARSQGQLRIVVGAVAARPQYFPDICALAHTEELTHELANEIGQRYAQAIDPITDARGSASYRRRIIVVEVRRALEELAAREEVKT